MMRSIRKNLNVILIVVVAAFAATIFYGYGARQPLQPGGAANAAATVNNAAISFNDLNLAFQSVIAQYDQATLSALDENAIVLLRRIVLENLINNELLYQEARSQGVRTTDAEVSTRIDELRTQFPSPEDWNRFLQFQNLDMRTLREAFRRETMIRKLSETLGSDIVIPDDAVRSYYDENRELFTVPARYSLSQITVPTREEADALLTKLYLGRDFSELALENSTDPFRERGGERGWVTETLLPENARETIALQAGQNGGLTEPIEGTDGFTIYKVLEYQPGEETSYEEGQEQIRDFLRREQEQIRINNLLTELRGKSEIVISELLIPEIGEAADRSEDPSVAPEDSEAEILPGDALELRVPETTEPDQQPEALDELGDAPGAPMTEEDRGLDTSTLPE
ncbi:MAG TPA: SurA N-terminal domain-containing protein [Atribacteraceae bacterium]|nr:SurA N-terminal domain-containing protein [Atribacteraceae bacterium]